MEKRDYPEPACTFAFQKAYLDSRDLDQSFFNYVNEVIGRRDERENPIPPRGHESGDKRWKFFPFITGPHPYKMLQAARGSWKSSIGAVDYATWRIGREWFLTGESKIRIMNASEATPLATRNTRWQKVTMEWNPRYQRFCGIHHDKGKNAQWGIKGLLSRQRKDDRIGEITITPFGMDSASSGFHYDLLIIDDLMAERSSTTKDQIEKCYDFYRLLHSILVKDGQMLILSTRWHELDIYARIEQENDFSDDKHKFRILKLPAVDEKTRELNFPEILSEEKLDFLRQRQGPYIFSCQYALKAIPDEKRTIKSEWIKFRSPYHLRQKHLNIYTSADFAWTEMKRSDFRRSRMPDFTVIFTIAVDEQWNYIFLDQYRKRCNKVEAVEELFRQWDTHKTDTVVLQKYDQRGVKEMIEQYAYEHNKAMYVQWITYPPNLGKVARFETLLQPNFAGYKIYLMEGMQWFIDDELMDLPRPKFDDGMDTLSNIIRYAKPAHRTHVDDEISAQKRRIMMLKAGVDPWSPKEDFIHY